MPCTEAYKEHIMYTFNGFARPSYTMRLSTHGVTGADGGKKKYPLNTSLPQKNREIIFPYFFKNGLTMGEKFENQSMMRQVLK